MFKILVCCSSGMTANMLVRSMKQEAKAKNTKVMIWTAAKTAVVHSFADADCILVAPQIASSLSEIQELVNGRIPVAVIDGQDFSNMNGKAVLEFACSLINK